jgi:hypothetical protein
MIGFTGLISMLKGAKGEARAVHVHKGHVGSDERRAHEILAALDPGSAHDWVRAAVGERPSPDR